LAQCRRTRATPAPKSDWNFGLQPPAGASLSPQQNVGVMAAYRHRNGRGASKLRFAAVALALTSSHACAETFQQMWMGRIARPPADDQEASVYWEDKWDARGKRFKANEVSCAHRTEAFGTIFVVTNLENGKKIRCPVQDRGPYARGRVLDFSLGAARQIGCDGLCRVTVRRAGYE
jgi:rare lipoprotein A (peptidoglycan hydrolase)